MAAPTPWTRMETPFAALAATSIPIRNAHNTHLAQDTPVLAEAAPMPDPVKSNERECPVVWCRVGREPGS